MHQQPIKPFPFTCPAMGDVVDLEEELEPLFDYSRVQPINLVPVVDDGTFEPFPYGLDGKKRKRKRGKDGKCGKGSCGVVNLDEDEEEKGRKEEDKEEDWLPLPPRNMANSKQDSEVDETLQKLRLKKMELASFVQSADSIVKEVIETAKNQIMNSKSAVESGGEHSKSQAEQSNAQVKRQKIVVCIQAKDESKQFRVYKDEKLDKLFKTCAERSNLNFEKVVFCFDGDKICPGASPDSLGMDDGDMIEMHVKSY